MNIRRGLFRVWLVCSVLYVTGVFAVGIPAIWNEFEDKADPFEELLVPLVPPQPWSKLAMVTGAAFGVPAVVFGLGMAYLWAFSGFRESGEE